LTGASQPIVATVVVTATLHVGITTALPSYAAGQTVAIDVDVTIGAVAVAGGRFVAFVLQRPDGREVDGPYLAELGAHLGTTLGAALAAHERHDEALAQLLAAVQRDPQFDDEAARKRMLDLFALLGNDHPLTQRYRAELAAQVPGIRLQLESACRVLRCQVALPRRPATPVVSTRKPAREMPTGVASLGSDATWRDGVLMRSRSTEAVRKRSPSAPRRRSSAPRASRRPSRESAAPTASAIFVVRFMIDLHVSWLVDLRDP